jgi:hypothetical protein
MEYKPMPPTLDSVTHRYVQDEDSSGRVGHEIQDLTVSTQDAGGGHYLIIKTERWAVDFDDIDTFVAMLRKVIQAAEPTPESE